ncbi:glutamyl-tRNA synthetase 1 [Bartonella bacilliformis Peru38]|uniref:Glutamate--tRNA ligase 1 n=2 Tax=Bartonella bacilliformis TaxID=774 RepID=SYE1_BARBK|nr:glutamate--tRNA ligase [Bartonella bacilliformis]A1USF5.1 RecName: Full=Glutamate--tRNA ligase 1; AltName: Full=Glutamyl-tRNA synthetase 1; Short=GluRS 1 [Bartonella bacilliformis KC583]ABM44719.1 glutamyl-tRNA synthetase [Bartonella bacilliformis KC583]AMG85728.1 glutamate--tRNA ligase [Bartonella bacilliformis]EKS44829.1 glutamyl-tRNA ligase [Bartonella bacilliformis INS]EYS89793.1 glutamyl-tRNA synthetase 1 [Bartonella bacilliformis San Pedro600-02]EYS95135.1 glutamyl-tRNA synthetase 1 
MSVITRFAPSPTGFLHIGGARTALFNWLYAKHHGGKMLLRIEDTDRERSTDAAVKAIINGLHWIGLSYDGDPISQFERTERHREVAEQLVKDGKAYYCYASPEELAEMRESARAEGRPPHYDGHWRDRDISEAPKGIKPVIRIKAPKEGATIVRDRVQGDVLFPNKDLDDFIILRSDGTPTYMLAVVVDDHDMGITHIIRGDDHLTNAARQTIIFNAMGWKIPVMAHIPLIHGEDGAKLSKRHGALGVDAYRAMGYLPAALRNYLVRLGWSHGNDEIISTEDMISWFDIDDINKGAARLDFKKLNAINGHYIRMSTDQDLFDSTLSILPEIESGLEIIDKLDKKHRAQFLAAIPHIKERSKTLLELIDGASFIFTKQPLLLDEKAKMLLNEDGQAILKSIYPILESCSYWDTNTLDEALRHYAQKQELKFGTIAQPLRAALTGRATSPGVFDVLVLLGRNESLNRINQQINTTKCS